MKIKKITIHREEAEQDLVEGIFLVNPQWTHLDEKEVQEKLEKGEKLFKVSFEDLK